MTNTAETTGQRTDAPRRIEIDHPMPGAAIIRVGDEQLAVGFPEEVVKAWMRAGARVTAWLIPDVRSARGLVHWALEFPLYHALFVQGLHAQGRKIPVLVHERDWSDVVAYLRLSLHGLTRDEMIAEGVERATADMLAAEGASLALRRPDGAVAPVEDFLEPRFFDGEGVATLGDLRVRSHGRNTYSFYTADDRVEEVRLETDAEEQPPWARPLPMASAPVLPQPFEVITLGTTHGFDPQGPCTSLAVQANGRFLLVDSGPYVRSTLRHAGIALNQLSAVIVTHAHEDHAVGLSALLDLTHRLKLFLTRENAAILRRKLAILNPAVASPATLLDDAFDVVLVQPGQVHDFFGLRMRFHYTLHSIPCTGVELSMRDGAHERRALVVGDHNSRANVERLAREGRVDARRLDELLGLYAWRGDLVVADAGAGAIHGAAADFRGSPADQVAYVHTAGLAEAERHLYSRAEPGHRFTLIPENARPTALERGLGSKALMEAFAATLDADWLNALLDAAVAVSVNRGLVVVRQQDSTSDLYVALTGALSVVAERNGRPTAVAEIQSGEIFGEMAALTGAPRSASVVATTPARLLRIPGEVWQRFAQEARLVPSLPEIWQRRSDLDRVSFLASASVTTRNALARRAERRAIGAGSTLIREGSTSTTVYVLVRGRAQVYRGTEPLLVDGTPVILDPGSLVGETAPFLKKPRNASIVTLDECEVLALRGADFKAAIERSPQLLTSISHVVRARMVA